MVSQSPLDRFKRLQSFAWERWGKAEKSFTRRQAGAEARCEFWRKIHAQAEDRVEALLAPAKLSALATEVVDTENWPKLHRKAHWRHIEGFPDIPYTSVVNEKKVYRDS